MTTSTSKRVLRWIGAILAGSVTAFIGLYATQSASAETGNCSLRDVAAWQSQINDPQEEATPTYILRVTEAFLEACPDRPETRHAHNIAGRAANQAGDVKRAISHLEAAGAVRDLAADFALIAAYLTDRKSTTAWQVRDRMVARWQAKTARASSLRVSQIPVSGGIVQRTQFTDPDSNVRVAWTAIPEGGGWPATLSLGPPRPVLSFQHMRSGGRTQPYMVIELYRCEGRRILARIDQAMPHNDVDQTAMAAMQAYLSRPDGTRGAAGPRGLSSCLWPNRLLPSS